MKLKYPCFHCLSMSAFPNKKDSRLPLGLPTLTSSHQKYFCLNSVVFKLVKSEDGIKRSQCNGAFRDVKPLRHRELELLRVLASHSEPRKL